MERVQKKLKYFPKYSWKLHEPINSVYHKGVDCLYFAGSMIFAIFDPASTFLWAVHQQFFMRARTIASPFCLASQMPATKNLTSWKEFEEIKVFLKNNWKLHEPSNSVYHKGVDRLCFAGSTIFAILDPASAFFMSSASAILPARPN